MKLVFLGVGVCVFNVSLVFDGVNVSQAKHFVEPSAFNERASVEPQSSQGKCVFIKSMKKELLYRTKEILSYHTKRRRLFWTSLIICYLHLRNKNEYRHRDELPVQQGVWFCR